MLHVAISCYASQAILEDQSLRVDVVEADAPVQAALAALTAAEGSAAPAIAATLAARHVAESLRLARATADAIFGR